MSTGRTPEPADQRASTSVVTAPPSTRDDWSNIPKLKADVSFPDASQAAFGLKHAGIDTISSFPLQGGDSLAASLSGSVQGSAHHSLCIDDLGELPPENATGDVLSLNLLCSWRKEVCAFLTDLCPCRTAWCW